MGKNGGGVGSVCARDAVGFSREMRITNRNGYMMGIDCTQLLY
jgi:hypothetical protein